MTKWLAWIVAMEAVLCAVLGAAVLGREGAPDVDGVADVRPSLRRPRSLRSLQPPPRRGRPRARSTSRTICSA
jgi:hypothetical protein